MLNSVDDKGILVLLRDYNRSIIRRGNAAEHACPEAKTWQPHHWTT
jgi:hypothetical protein